MQALIQVEEAEAIIRKHLPTSSVEEVPLDLAHGRFLKQAIDADRPLPPFDRVMMDGIAINHASYQVGNTSFPIEATQAAGAPAIALSDPNACIEVMTGCVLPVGCDCVIPVELIDVNEQTASLLDDVNPKQHQHIHPEGSDTPSGNVLVNAGQQLHATELTIAASVGTTTLQVAALPRILVITTGDEVVAPDDTPLPHQIRRSHATTLKAALTGMQLGVVKDQHAPDNPEQLQAVLENALQGNFDIILLTGGVSRGKYDHVAPVLKKLLGTPHFHGIAQRPGKPMAFWTYTGDGSNGREHRADGDDASDGKECKQALFALPGNPVSVMACAARYLFPAIREMLSGQAYQPTTLPTIGNFNCPPTFTGLIPCRISNGRIQLTPASNSGNFLALAGTQGIAELPGSMARKDLLNEPATFYPWA